MNGTVGVAVVVAALLLAVATLIAAVRDRPVNRWHLAGMALVEVLAIVYVVLAVVRLAGGARPHEYATFVGYLVAFVLIVPLAALLARLEPTRWGSIVATVGAVVMPILVVRLQQVWTGVG